MLLNFSLQSLFWKKWYDIATWIPEWKSCNLLEPDGPWDPFPPKPFYDSKLQGYVDFKGKKANPVLIVWLQGLPNTNQNI